MITLVMRKAYYNEIDTFAASWLRELIKAGHIADGEVDERDIRDVTPNDLRGFTQCHFFAGIGGWSYALRRAGWSDNTPVWTGSCPCQPFSAAGKGAGVADERHLWPSFSYLIEQCQPPVLFGEQVEAAIKHGWLDLVQDDLEGIGYAVGAVGFPAASVGAPHIRQRLYFVGKLDHATTQRLPLRAVEALGREETRGQLERSGNGGLVADPNGRDSSAEREQRSGEQRLLAEGGGVIELGYSNNPRPQGLQQRGDGSGERSVGSTGLANFWSPCDWLPCTDGKARPVEPGTFPLAHGATNRVGRLRGYGNAIVAPQAQAFIEAYLDIT